MNTDTHRCEASRSAIYNAIFAGAALILAGVFALVLMPYAWVTGCSLAALAALLGIRVMLIPRAALMAKMLGSIVAVLAAALAGSLLIDWFA